MAGIRTGMALALFAAIGAAYFVPSNGQREETAEQAGSNFENRYQLIQAGVETGCYVSKGLQISATNAELTFDQGCNDISAAYAEARIWAEEADGSIAFMNGKGDVTLRLATGDGLAYEAFGAGAPLVALSYATN